MIKTPFVIYYDIETYGKYLKNTQQYTKIQNTTHEKLLKPYLRPEGGVEGLKMPYFDFSIC